VLAELFNLLCNANQHKPALRTVAAPGLWACPVEEQRLAAVLCRADVSTDDKTDLLKMKGC
jgi:hypothetical protein